MSFNARVMIAVLGLALASGCKKDADPGAAGSAASPDGAAAKQALIAKINIYVACLNNMNPVVHDSLKGYLAWADAEAGPALDKASGGINAVGRETTYGYECFKRDGGLDTIESKGPKVDDLDKAGAAYKKALLAVMDTVGKASVYYEHKDYKDDKLANGKTMHKPLLAAFAAFDQATGDLEAVLQKIQDKMTVEDLAELEKTEGKKALWHQRDVMRSAEMFMRALSAEPNPDAAKLAPASDAYAKSFQELKDWTDKNKAEADKNVLWGTFVRESDELLTQIKELNRGFRDAKKAPERGDGSHESILGKYNQLVTQSNDLWH
jgi:hypothetical protein